MLGDDAGGIHPEDAQTAAGINKKIPDAASGYSGRSTNVDSRLIVVA